MLTLCPAILLNLFISSNRVFFWRGKYVGFSAYETILSIPEVILLLPFQFGCIFFSHLIALTKTSSIMLNRMKKVGILALFLILEEKLLILHHSV